MSKRMSFPHWLLPAVLSSMALSACAPSISSISVRVSDDTNVFNVEATINDSPASTMGTPVLRVARAAPNSSFVTVGDMTPATGSSVHRREGVVLPEGQFRVQVQVPYQPLFQSSVQTVSASRDVTVALPPGCFTFDSGQAGWTASDHFFEIETTGADDFGVEHRLCVGQTPLIAANGENLPPRQPALPPGLFSINMPLGQRCFSNPPADMRTNYVAADFLSPPLAGVPGWDTAAGYELRAFVRGGGVTADPNDPLLMQLILLDQNNQARTEVDSSGRVFHPLGGRDFQSLGMTRDAVTSVNRVILRVFVPRNAGQLPDASVLVDRVCPRP